MAALFLCQRRANKFAEERLGSRGLRLELRMVLHRHEPRVTAQLDNLDQLAVGTEADGDEIMIDEVLPVAIVEFVAMPVTLMDDIGAVSYVG